MGTVVAKRLSCDDQVIGIFPMQRKTAREIVRKGQGDWAAKNREVLILFWRDENGRYHPPINQKESKNQCYVAPAMMKAVQYCIGEQERERKQIKERVTPLPGISVTSQVRDKIRETVLAQPAVENNDKRAREKR